MWGIVLCKISECRINCCYAHDWLDDSQAAVEEGIVVGGGCTLLRLAAKVDGIKATLENGEQQVGE